MILVRLRAVAEAHALVEIRAEGIERGEGRVALAAPVEECGDEVARHLLLLVQQVYSDQPDAAGGQRLAAHVHVELDQPHAADERAITKRAVERVGWRVHPVAQTFREAAHLILGPQAHSGIGVRRDARERSKLFVGQWADSGRHDAPFPGIVRHRALASAVVYNESVLLSATVISSACLRAHRQRKGAASDVTSAEGIFVEQASPARGCATCRCSD